MTVREEGQYSDPIGEFTTMFNRRVAFNPLNGDWVRIRPPTLEEIECLQENPWYLPFLRVGSLGTLTEDLPDLKLVQLSIKGNQVLIEREGFLCTWVRAVEQREW